jgi:DNA polymerase-3 subunit alpha
MGLELKIKNIDLLNELGVKKTKGLQLKVNLTSLNKELIKEMEAVFKEYSGNTPVYLNLRDDDNNISLELLSRKFRVRAVNDLIKEIKRIGNVKVEPVY